MNLRIRDRLFWGLEISSGGRAYPSNKLFVWTPVGYSRRKYRDILSRLSKTGQIQKVVTDGQVQLRLADSGRRRLLFRFPILNQAGKSWDGFWRIVMFDIPEVRHSRRDRLRRSLIKMGFGRLQDSAYISAYDWDPALFGGGILLLEAKQKHLGNPKNMASKIWNLPRLAKDYQQVIDRLTTRFGIKDAKKRDEFLRKTYQEYLQVLLLDPWLPKELLPDDWPGAKCRKFLLQAGAVKG